MTKATKKKASELTKTLLETAHDMRKSGILDRKSLEKITRRHPGGDLNDLDPRRAISLANLEKN